LAVDVWGLGLYVPRFGERWIALDQCRQGFGRVSANIIVPPEREDKLKDKKRKKNPHIYTHYYYYYYYYY